MSNSWSDFNDIFDMNVSECRKYLDETMDNYRFTLELTLNYPRTHRYKRLIKSSRDKLLRDLMSYISHHCAYIKTYEEHIEKSNDGYEHLHVQAHCSSQVPYSVEGAVMEVVNTYVSQLPKRTLLTLPKYHYSQKYGVFRCPSILVQWTPVEDLKRTGEWCDYIRKENI